MPTECELEEEYPAIPWREPVMVHTFQGATGFGCRYCIARYGLKDREVGTLPQTEDEFTKHLKQQHNRERYPERN